MARLPIVLFELRRQNGCARDMDVNCPMWKKDQDRDIGSKWRFLGTI